MEFLDRKKKKAIHSNSADFFALNVTYRVYGSNDDINDRQ